MDGVTEFLAQYGSIVLFLIVFAEQIGLPLPAMPLLLMAGALAGAGKMNLTLAILLSSLACVAGDVIWYELGRRRGRQVLSFLCRISLEPDFCVSRTENLFTRHGILTLVIAKFIPGLSTLAPTLAGLFGIELKRFLFFDALGALLWTLVFVLPGYLFSAQLEAIVAHEARAGSFLLLALGISLVAYIAYKFIRRQWVLRALHVARITVDELKGLMDSGHEVLVVDLRGALDHKADPYTIPGARSMTTEELEHRHHEISRHQDVILLCACPNEATAAKMALLLRRKGIMKVRPLAGGIEAWRERAYPLVARPVAGE